MARREAEVELQQQGTGTIFVNCTVVRKQCMEHTGVGREVDTTGGREAAGGGGGLDTEGASHASSGAVTRPVEAIGALPIPGAGDAAMAGRGALGGGGARTAAAGVEEKAGVEAGCCPRRKESRSGRPTGT